MEYYWELIQRDGTRTEVPPAFAETITKRIANKQPIILKTAVIPSDQVQQFRITDKPFTTQKLLEDVSQAFKEPMLETKNEEEFIICRWVKRKVSSDKWNKYYSQSPGYYKIADDNGMVMLGVFLPVHQIDQTIFEYCSKQEEDMLETKRTKLHH